MSWKRDGYVAFFKEVAQKNKVLHHQVDDKCAFAEIFTYIDAFGQRNYNINEYIQGKRSRLDFPAMLLDSYDADYRDNGSDHRQKIYNGGLVIMDKPKDQTPEEKNIVFTSTEEVCEDIISYIRKWYKENQKVFHGTFSKFTTEFVEDGDYCGCRLNIQIEAAYNPQTFYNADKWF